MVNVGLTWTATVGGDDEGARGPGWETMDRAGFMTFFVFATLYSRRKRKKLGFKCLVPARQDWGVAPVMAPGDPRQGDLGRRVEHFFLWLGFRPYEQQKKDHRHKDKKEEHGHMIF